MMKAATQIPGSQRLHGQLVRAALEHLRVRFPRGVWWSNENRPTKDSRGSWIGANVTPGPADILGCYQGRHIEIECKTGAARLNKAQRDHCVEIQAAGGVFILIRDPGEIEKIKEVMP